MASLEKKSSPPFPGKDFPGDKVSVASPQLESNDDLGANSGVDEKSLLRKLDLKLLPALTLLYLLSFLDRSNGTYSPSPETARGRFMLLTGSAVANARVEGLTTDLHMSRLRTS